MAFEISVIIFQLFRCPIDMRIAILLCFILMASFSRVSAQDEEVQDERFTIDTPVTLNFEEEEEEEPEKKKKKVKKKVFYGIKTRKGFTRKGYGNRITYELFYVLKKPQTPQTFVRDIYWYDYTRKEVRKTERFDPDKGVLLHGPYEKRMGEVVLERGIFYKGTKHGRWLTYDRDSVLKDKKKYFRGWPKESLVSYYDAERKKMKEITPIEYGEKDGYYYRFFENGQMAITGEYRWDQKIGDWVEYYPNKRRKKIIAYPKEPFEESIRPYIKAEWNEKGKQIYRNNRASR
jgi:antitoxin component YwqK of YwqJK toxin-antitoxin module